MLTSYEITYFYILKMFQTVMVINSVGLNFIQFSINLSKSLYIFNEETRPFMFNGLFDMYGLIFLFLFFVSLFCILFFGLHFICTNVTQSFGVYIWQTTFTISFQVIPLCLRILHTPTWVSPWQPYLYNMTLQHWPQSSELRVDI